MARGWLNKAKKPVANRDLWEPLIDPTGARPGRRRLQLGQGPQRRPHERPRRPPGRRGGDDAAGAVGRHAAHRPRSSGPARGAAGPARPRRPQAGDRRPPSSRAGRLPGQPRGRRRPFAGWRRSSPPSGSCTTTSSSSRDSVWAPSSSVPSPPSRRESPSTPCCRTPSPSRCGRPPPRPRSASCSTQPRAGSSCLGRKASSRVQAGAALARRDAWLARNADEAVAVVGTATTPPWASRCAPSRTNSARRTSGWWRPEGRRGYGRDVHRRGRRQWRRRQGAVHAGRPGARRRRRVGRTGFATCCVTARRWPPTPCSSGGARRSRW